MTDEQNIRVDYCVITLIPKSQDDKNFKPHLETSSFVFQRSNNHIKVTTGWGSVGDRKLMGYLKSNPGLLQNYYVTVHVFRGENSFTYPKSKVVPPTGCFWSTSFSEVSRYIPGADRWNFSFKFVFQTESECGKEQRYFGEKGVQCLPYSDEYRSFQRLSSDYGRFLNEDLEKNGVIKCGDFTVKFHKDFLRGRSKFFNEELKAAKDVIDLSHIDPAVLNVTVRYAYTGEHPNMSSELAQKIYKAGNVCDTGSLRDMAVSFLINSLTPENALKYLSFADDDDFKKRVIDYTIEKRIPLLDEYWVPFCQDKQHAEIVIDVLNKFVRKLSSSISVQPN